MLMKDLPMGILFFLLVTSSLTVLAGILVIIAEPFTLVTVASGALLIGLGGFMSFGMVMLLTDRPSDTLVPDGKGD